MNSENNAVRWFCLLPGMIAACLLAKLTTTFILVMAASSNGEDEAPSSSLGYLIFDLLGEPYLIALAPVMACRWIAPKSKRRAGWIAGGTLSVLFLVVTIVTATAGVLPAHAVGLFALGSIGGAITGAATKSEDTALG